MILALQRTVGNTAVVSALVGSVPARSDPHLPACVQRVSDDEGPEEEQESKNEEPEDEGTIAEQIRYRREMASTSSPRLKERLKRSGIGPMRHPRGGAERRSRPFYGEKKEKGFWNDERPEYYKETWDHILGGMNTRGAGKKQEWQCPECDGWFGKINVKKGLNGITIDHHTPYKDWILRNAAPDEEGRITKKAAQDAYNDLKNLVGMCRDCNSSKNNPKKGLFG